VKGVDGILRAFDVEGVAGDFQLFLPEFREELFTLARPLLIRMTRLSGKNVSDKLEEAEIVALGRRQIEVRASFKAEPLTNLKLSMYPVSGGRVYSDIYCKVLERQADEDGHFFVHFTAVPPEVESLLVGLRSQSSAPKPTENR
jgi:hypothetical protein